MSYGARLALEMLRADPAGTRAAIIDSAYIPGKGGRVEAIALAQGRDGAARRGVRSRREVRAQPSRPREGDQPTPREGRCEPDQDQCDARRRHERAAHVDGLRHRGRALQRGVRRDVDPDPAHDHRERAARRRHVDRARDRPPRDPVREQRVGRRGTSPSTAPTTRRSGSPRPTPTHRRTPATTR